MSCKVAALNLTPLDTYKYPKEVAWKLDQNNTQEHIHLAQIINNSQDISGVIIQHEYGIFGGEQGENLLFFMKECTKPMLVTFHTVLPNPTQKMQSVTQEIIKLASTIVVLTNSSKILIEKIYTESIGKVFVIPHGIHPTAFSNQKEYKKKLELEHHTVLSTFGLLSKGKGIEYVINSLPEVIKKYPSILYLVLGETHPVIRRQQGETYRKSLLKLVTKLKLEKQVKFYDQYLTLPELLDFLKATNIYISTSTNPNQAVSGTLSYALGAGRAVISTEFAQSKELVTHDIGRLVPIQDSQALSQALLDLLSDPKRLRTMSKKAYTKTRPMLWSHVAREYIQLLTRTILPPLKIDHLLKMTDEFGLFQFAQLSTPNKAFGYTLDDNARALILCCWLIKKEYTKELENLIVIYFHFIQKCSQQNGSFINYINFEDKLPTDQNKIENLEDATARAFWALSELMTTDCIAKNIRQEAQDLFLQTSNRAYQLTYIRAKAFSLKALTLAYPYLAEQQTQILENITKFADSLLFDLEKNSNRDWNWFEGSLHYNNALLPESLLLAGQITKNSKYTEKGILSLEFLIRKTFSETLYRPIGHSHWYTNTKKRSHYDQQPEDPASMILALVCAYKNTHDESYKNLAKKCFTWFLGNNTLKLALYDENSNGCYDGLHPDRVNLNQGAESLISYLMSRFSMNELP